MWKGGISFLSHRRGWIIRRSYCGHFRSFDVLTAAGCRGGAATNQRPGVSRWSLPPFAPLGKKDSLPLHWKSNGWSWICWSHGGQKNKISVTFKSKTLKFFSPSTFMNREGIHIFQDWLKQELLYNCYNNWNKGKDRKEDGRKQRKSGRTQRTDPFPSSLSVYWTVIMNNTLHM